MFRYFTILSSGVTTVLGELKLNKLRTFLSLFGITIGIFCIIGILAIIDSYRTYVQNSLKSLTYKVIWVDKYDYSDGQNSDYPWWKYVKRPVIAYGDMQIIKQNTKQADKVCFYTQFFSGISYNSSELLSTRIIVVSEEFNEMQDFKIMDGRYISPAEFERGTPCCIMGYTYATDLFNDAKKAIGKQIEIKGQKVYVLGVTEKQGDIPFSMDSRIIISYRFFTSFSNPLKADDNLIMVKAKDNVSIESLVDELRGNMRSLRKLNPKQEDNFALNNMNELVDEQITELFGVLNTAGWAIAGLSLLVGAFGVANIMFVSVRERTPQIGLKKALGAKNKIILIEFLIESIFLCLMGGIIGLSIVWILSLILSGIFPFKVFVSLNIILLAFSVCIIIGVLSGIIPAIRASKLNPVVAIRFN